MIPKNVLILVDAIRATSKKLSKDDEGLVSTVSIFAKQGRLITQRQAEYLQGIYRKCTGGGQYEARQYVR